jgi:hypothetical protein
MGEKERAEALLQAAGVSGVKVEPAAEQVTVSRAELEALRAGAQAPAETPGQAYARQQQEQTAAQASAALPEGILSLEELQRQEQAGGSHEAGMSHAERMRANEQFCVSAQYHMKNGSL